MNDLISIIGTIASVGSIPLAIYLFIKSKENKHDKVKREIVRILSHQIGSGRQLTTFEIQAVINSKLRENKINTDQISVDEVIEDLISEVISNPLIDNQKKDFYLTNFKTIYSKGKLLSFIDSITTTELTSDKSKDQITTEVETIIQQEVDARKDIQLKSIKVDSLASWFAVIGTMITVILGVLTSMGDKILINPIFDFLNKNQELATLFISLFAGILTLFSATILRKIISKKRDDKK